MRFVPMQNRGPTVASIGRTTILHWNESHGTYKGLQNRGPTVASIGTDAEIQRVVAGRTRTVIVGLVPELGAVERRDRDGRGHERSVVAIEIGTAVGQIGIAIGFRCRTGPAGPVVLIRVGIELPYDRRVGKGIGNRPRSEEHT